VKIAIVSDSIYPYHKGGKETRIFELSTRLAKAGNDVHIYTMKWWDQPGRIRKENGVTLHAISRKYKLYSGGRRSMVQGVLFGVACFRLLSEPFDVVDVDHMPYFPLFSMWIVCRLKRKPMTATWHEVWGGSYWRDYLGHLGFIASLLERLTVRIPDHIVAVSEFTAERLETILHSQKPITWIENGIDTAAIRRLKPSKQTSDVVFVGRLLSHKNVDVLIRAVAILTRKRPDITCLIISDGPERPQLERLSAKMGVSDNIVFTGFIEHDVDKFRLMKASRVFAHPSTREGFGIVALEALACGLPVVTTNHPENAARYMITPEIGRICKPTPQSLARAIESVLNDQDLRDTTEVARSFDWRVSARALEKVYAR